MKSPDTHRVRVLIVEDSLVVRRLLAYIVARDPRLLLAGAVGSAEEALLELPRMQADVISMDIRLPGMDGLEATRRIMSERPTPIVVIADAVEDGSLRISMNALRAGALSVVEKPVGLATQSYEAIAETICTQLFIMSQVPVIRQRRMGGHPPAGSEAAPTEAAGAFPLYRPGIIGMAASTGGPPAFARLLAALPVDFPVPILLLQHMGAPFMEGFAAWLDGLLPLSVKIAQDREVPVAGRVYVAPGDRHMILGPDGHIRITDSPAVSGQRPSATVMFSAMAEAVGARALGILLTGMGEDGAAGLTRLRRAGGFTITENESTAVVYGMPAAAVRMGGSCLGLPIEHIAPRLLRIVAEGVTAK